MPYKRMRSGAYIGGRRYVRRRVRKVMRRVSRGRYVGRSLTNRGPRPNFMFHRWGIANTYSAVDQAGGVNFNTSACYYNGTTGILSTATGTTSQNNWAFSIGFALNQIANVSEFTALFDQYRINMVKVCIRMVSNPDAPTQINVTTPDNRANFYPGIWYAPDQDDINLESLNGIKEYERVKHKILQPNKTLQIVLRPRVNGAIYNNTTTTAYTTSTRGQYIDLARTTVPHYGLKAIIDFEGNTPTGADSAQNFSFKIDIKYYFQCKNVR